MKPIDTLYRGNFYRSRLEARWGVALSEMGVKFEYEPQGYELLCGPYLPDFFLIYPDNLNFSGYPDAGSWLEVKGRKPTQEDLSKLLLLTLDTNHSGILVWGPPWEFQQYFTHRSGNHGWLPSGKFADVVHRFTDRGDPEEAIIKAQKARFEHGIRP